MFIYSCLCVPQSRVLLAKGRDHKEVIRMDSSSTLDAVKNGASVVDPKSTVGGGVEDVYGEDRATEDQLITPWTFSVARCYFLY